MLDNKKAKKNTNGKVVPAVLSNDIDHLKEDMACVNETLKQMNLEVSALKVFEGKMGITTEDIGKMKSDIGILKEFRTEISVRKDDLERMKSHVDNLRMFQFKVYGISSVLTIIITTAITFLLKK